MSFNDIGYQVSIKFGRSPLNKVNKMLLANLTKINIDNDPDMFSAPLAPQYLGGTRLKSPNIGGFRGLEDF
jgi:hypothetical protein